MPDFVIESLSDASHLVEACGKMELWIGNNARLGWLINPEEQRILVYESGSGRPVTISGDWIEGSGPVEGFRIVSLKCGTAFFGQA